MATVSHPLRSLYPWLQCAKLCVRVSSFQNLRSSCFRPYCVTYLDHTSVFSQNLYYNPKPNLWFDGKAHLTKVNFFSGIIICCQFRDALVSTQLVIWHGNYCPVPLWLPFSLGSRVLLRSCDLCTTWFFQLSPCFMDHSVSERAFSHLYWFYRGTGLSSQRLIRNVWEFILPRYHLVPHLFKKKKNTKLLFKRKNRVCLLWLLCWKVNCDY